MQKTQECLLERREAVGRGTWVSPPTLWGSQVRPLAAGQGRPRERGVDDEQSAVPLTGVGWGWVSNVVVPKAPPEREGLAS